MWKQCLFSILSQKSQQKEDMKRLVLKQCMTAGMRFVVTLFKLCTILLFQNIHVKLNILHTLFIAWWWLKAFKMRNVVISPSDFTLNLYLFSNWDNPVLWFTLLYAGGARMITRSLTKQKYSCQLPAYVIPNTSFKQTNPKPLKKTIIYMLTFTVWKSDF